jgi:hypothetical protein
LVVTQKREQVYSHKWTRVLNTQKNRGKRYWRELPRSKDGGRNKGKPRFIEVLVPEHVGWEIACEKRACPACVRMKA